MLNSVSQKIHNRRMLSENQTHLKWFTNTCTTKQILTSTVFNKLHIKACMNLVEKEYQMFPLYFQTVSHKNNVLFVLRYSINSVY